MNTRRFKGEYATDGRDRRRNVRAEAGHRCIRCGHPFETGKHGKGEWSPCDEQCSHDGPVRIQTYIFPKISRPIRDTIRSGIVVEAQWRILTVHHLDGDKSNDWWANCLSLCQRCHLTVQSKVDPRVPYFLEHSEWFKPYAAAFYAKKYLGQTLTRKEVIARLDELLSLERLA
jgi:hypothetical protein